MDLQCLTIAVGSSCAPPSTSSSSPPAHPSCACSTAGSTLGVVGVLAAGLHRVGYDLSLIQHADEGWNATFFVTGRMQSIAGGWADAPTPWRAVQRAGWDAIQHAERFF